jgi:hypothetical protein
MPSPLADIQTYWQTSPFLCGLVPYSSVYSFYAPEVSTTFPYVVIRPVGNVPTFVTGRGLGDFTTYSCRVYVYHSDPDVCHNLGATIAQYLDHARFTPASMDMYRTGGPLTDADPTEPARVYFCFLDYEYSRNEVLLPLGARATQGIAAGNSTATGKGTVAIPPPPQSSSSSGQPSSSSSSSSSSGH